MTNNRLQGSADGFLTNGWTALTSLSLSTMRLETATLTAALQLPVLEDVRIYWCTLLGGELQVHQLTGSCPQVNCLQFGLGMWDTEARAQSCRLLDLNQLADLHVVECSLQAKVDLDLPSSLTRLRFGGSPVDFFWALLEAAKCAGRGAQLRKVICGRAEAHLQPAQWGASLEDQHRRLGCQLTGLRVLKVTGDQEQLLSAVGAVASAAPSLVRPEVVIWGSLSCMEVSPVCSASLESIRLVWRSYDSPNQSPPQVLLTLLSGCTRLQEAVVHFKGKPIEGAAVKIRCHCCSQKRILPGEWCAGDDAYAFVRFLHAPCSEQGVQECTVLYACRAAGPEQAPL